MTPAAKFIIPQLVTFTNLSLGVIAIITSNFKLAAILIIVAAIIDRMDGKIARKFDAVSDFGKELDSLSDLISFGVAPAVVIWKAGLSVMGFWGYVLILIFVIAGAFRLARFNVINLQGSFMGMPITIAGALLAFSLFFRLDNAVYAVIMLVLSFLMVSKFKFKKI